MAFAVVFPVLLFAAVTRTTGEPFHGKSNANAATIFGNLLKPPPPPAPKNIFPVPFHGGTGRTQRHNADLGYQYQPPPPPPPTSIQSPSNFKFPAPFYKQYNFNFVPPPQAFSTTPSPNMFQKVSGWLFPSNQGGYDASAAPVSNIGSSKKDCNPCNVVPWIPVIRYDLAAKNLQNINPTYGAPSPTASPQFNPYSPQPFIPQSYSHLTPGVPHAEYGPPPQKQTFSPITGSLSSTYGPPSPTHTVDLSSKSPLSSTYGTPSSSFIPSQQFIPSSSYGVPSSSYDVPSSSYGIPSSSYRAPSSTYGPPSSTYGTPSPSHAFPGPTSSTFTPVTPINQVSIPNYQSSQFNDVDSFKITGPSAISNELQLPKIYQPSGFKNSYGEPITNSFGYNTPYPVSATAAESSKIRNEVLPHDAKPNKNNGSFALGNPAPFTSNKGRNIHTLQPVALPNLSVSPLPPIFNARPFRTISAASLLTSQFKNTNYNYKSTNNVEITKSVPLTEFTHSVEHPIKIVSSPLLDFAYGKNQNQSKAYRNIVNSFVIDQNRDISSQASEDHISATKTIQEINDSSFETTGSDAVNDINDMPSEMKVSNIPVNHKKNFADLRGATDDDVDKFRTEYNLQSIDSPLLYLKPSAPHKDFDNFLLEVSTASNVNDYELYDESQTTDPPQISTPSHLWDDNKSNYGESPSQLPTAQADSNKPKVVQIIIPYTSDQSMASGGDLISPPHKDWQTILEEYQARKVPSNTENYYHVNTASDVYESETTTTEDSRSVTDNYDFEKLNTPAILNDLYDVKEPPFDIIKLQNNIDDWTEQQYSQHHRATPKIKNAGKYAHAKQIPDEYFTTLSPTNYVTTLNYDYYDHEPSGSIRHSVTETSNKNETVPKITKEYNTILRDRGKPNKGSHKFTDDKPKPHIYTAASLFRSSTTTVAPWGKIETSISPLTKEKVYVVTSKPWREGRNTTDWYAEESFESMKTTGVDSEALASDNLPFKSPRFLNRPSFEGSEIMKSDASYGLSKSWHQRINDLEARMLSNKNGTIFPEGPQHVTTSTNMDEEITDTTTAGHPSEE